MWSIFGNCERKSWLPLPAESSRQFPFRFGAFGFAEFVFAAMVITMAVIFVQIAMNSVVKYPTNATADSPLSSDSVNLPDVIIPPPELSPSILEALSAREKKIDPKEFTKARAFVSSACDGGSVPLGPHAKLLTCICAYSIQLNHCEIVASVLKSLEQQLDIFLASIPQPEEGKVVDDVRIQMIGDSIKTLSDFSIR